MKTLMLFALTAFCFDSLQVVTLPKTVETAKRGKSGGGKKGKKPKSAVPDMTPLAV